jgi:hypothetical protein
VYAADERISTRMSKWSETLSKLEEDTDIWMVGEAVLLLRSIGDIEKSSPGNTFGTC